MHPQILRTWPRGRQVLAIRAHNLFQNNCSEDATNVKAVIDFSFCNIAWAQIVRKKMADIFWPKLPKTSSVRIRPIRIGDAETNSSAHLLSFIFTKTAKKWHDTFVSQTMQRKKDTTKTRPHKIRV